MNKIDIITDYGLAGTVSRLLAVSDMLVEGDEVHAKQLLIFGYKVGPVAYYLQVPGSVVVAATASPE